MKRNDIHLTPELIETQDYREFLRCVFKIIRERKHFSLAQFANRSGLKSRSFIHDVMSGKKRLTSRSIQKVALGLGLTGKLKNYFILLVEKDEPEVRTGKNSKAEIENKIYKLRMSLLSSTRQSTKEIPIGADSFYSNADSLVVYASLGSYENGASKSEIAARSKLPEKQFISVLNRMIEERIVSEKGGRFYPISSQIVFDKLGKNINFQGVFLETLKVSRERAINDFSSNEKLFFHSIFGVEKEKLSELKMKLRAAIVEFVQEHQIEECDHIAIVNVAFY